jgi:hypothetical protein
MARPAWWVAAGAMSEGDDAAAQPGTSAQAFAALGAHWPALAELSYADIGLTGRVASPESVGAAR